MAYFSKEKIKIVVEKICRGGGDEIEYLCAERAVEEITSKIFNFPF